MKTVELINGELRVYENRGYGFLSILTAIMVAASALIIDIPEVDRIATFGIFAFLWLGLIFLWIRSSRDRLLLAIDATDITLFGKTSLPWRDLRSLKKDVERTGRNRPSTIVFNDWDLYFHEGLLPISSKKLGSLMIENFPMQSASVEFDL